MKGQRENVRLVSWCPGGGSSQDAWGLGPSPGGESLTHSPGGCRKRSLRTSQGPSWLISPKPSSETSFVGTSGVSMSSRHTLLVPVCGRKRGCLSLPFSELFVSAASLLNLEATEARLGGRGAVAHPAGQVGDGMCGIMEGFLKVPFVLLPEVNSIQAKGLKGTEPTV